MPSGAPTKRVTSKTEFMRYVDDNPQAVEQLSDRLTEFRKINKHDYFGAWMRSKHLDEFTAAYDSWWLSRPELFPEVYKNVSQELLRYG